MKIINPANEEILANLEPDSTQSLSKKYQLVREGQKAWSLTPLQKRLSYLGNFQRHLKTQEDELAQVLCDEMGKPLTQAKNELSGARGRIQFFLDHSEKWLSEEWVHQETGLREKITYEPLGVIGNISAWNYPYLVGVNVFVPALLAGNTVLYKASEYTSLTGLKIQELLRASGVPEGSFQTILGGREMGEALLDLPLDAYFFTGSYRTGKSIFEKVAPKWVPCQLELGGKDPLYVTEDNKNIQKVAEAALDGAFYNNGQSCCAVERLYVHKEVYESFLDSFIKKLKKLQLGNPRDEGVYFGPLARQEQIGFLKAQIEDALAKGARVICGGKAIEGKGYYFEPTVLTQVNHQMTLMKEESFGPLIGIQKVRDDEEAVALMKDTEFGLTASVYSDSQERAESILSQLNTGTVYWNCCDRVSPHLPWSGRQHSGLGTTLSYAGIRTFVQAKSYHLKSN